MFLPLTKKECRKLGWDKLDIILVTGDAYIDSPFMGVSVIGKVLVRAGYRVGIIAQPDYKSDKDITRLGEPELFWGVTSGCVDSMVANYTALKKRRKNDDFTPGGENNRRPDRAVIVYSNLIRQHFKNTVPIVLGGIEASLRRFAHYDFWSNSVRRSILFDARADYLTYGMADRTVVELADFLKSGKDTADIRGLCYISKEPPAGSSPESSRTESKKRKTKKQGALLLPSFEEVKKDKDLFTQMFHSFYRNNDPVTANRLVQQQDTRYLIQNCPASPLGGRKLDEIYELDYERDAHPNEKKSGKIRALDTIRFSITSHRGCYGECNFCSIAVHQGLAVRERSEDSLLREAVALTRLDGFKGYILNIGGPSANMYGSYCTKMDKTGACADKRCLYPKQCKSLVPGHDRQINLLKRIRELSGVKSVFIASGIRFDLVMNDEEYGGSYLKEVVKHHVSGQMKIAPEHSEKSVLKKMGKPGQKLLKDFREKFYALNKELGRKQFLTYYLIAAHPGCEKKDMMNLRKFARKELKASPEQVQVFTPTPSTYSTLMYYTGKDPFTGEKLFVEINPKGREYQKRIIVEK